MPRTRNKLTVIALFMSLACAPAYSACGGETCCSEMGGVQYCDSSAGRLVCRNGEYSDCYCTRHAVMDMQKLTGCCSWQGGVLKTDRTGAVICRNGSYAEGCSLQNPNESIAAW